MALGFGRKKAADDAPLPADASVAIPDSDAAPVAAHAPSSPPNADAFDFTEFQTIADGGAADSVFNSPATPNTDAPRSGGASSTSASNALDSDDENAIDFDKLYAIEQQNATQNAARSAAPAPFVPPTATPQDSATPFYEPQVPAETAEVPKKKLPLLPILGAVGFLALAGGAASYFASQSGSAPDDAAPVTPTIVRPRSAPPQAMAPQAGAPATGATPNAPLASATSVGMRPAGAPPQAMTPNTGAQNTGAPNAGGRPGTGRIGGLSGASAVSPGIAPVSAQSAQLKALWKRGADAKHQGDIAGARRYWNQGLKIEPRNVGFRESIAKLPR